MNRRHFSAGALGFALGSTGVMADSPARKDPIPSAAPGKTMAGVSALEKFVIGESNSARISGRGRVHVPPVDAALSSNAAGLMHFDLAFQNGDHKINTIEAGMIEPMTPYVFEPGPTSRFKAFAGLRDRNGDDDFEAQVGWLNLTQGRSYVLSSLANAPDRVTTSGQPGFMVPIPRQPFSRDHDLVLHGFSVRRPAGSDANVRVLGVAIKTLNGNPAIEVILTDDSGTDARNPIEAHVSYAWIPMPKVLGKGSVSGSASGRRDGRGIPRGYAVLTGFRFEFRNSDHHLKRVGASVRDGGLAYFQDDNTDDPLRWQLHYAMLKA